MKEDVGSRMEGAVLTSTTTPTNTTPKPVLKMPGSWYYEEGMFRGDESSSPTSEADEVYLASLFTGQPRNVSENVEVPSSEHVAEIVGRQGCKIKSLRAKTNTYIKTPVRGEEPVFVVTGKPDDVQEAKREIECAAEHFTQIRASRRHSQGGAPAPGHVTAYVRVPLRVVGLVVGPKGATIKRIQQDTHTYIITPSREREPIFEVTGLPQNVEAARKEIEQHIYQRTGNMPITDPSASITHYTNDFANHPALTNATNVGPRASYGSLAAVTPSTIGQPPVRPRTNNYENNTNEYTTRPAPLTESFNFNNGMNNAMRGFQQNNGKAFSNGGASSPSFFPASVPAAFQPWSSSSYNPLGLTEQQQQTTDALYSHSAIISGASAWSSAFSSVLCNPLKEQRDEGLGDSPASGIENTYHLMSSIWADLEPRDENKHVIAPVLTV